MKIVAPDAYTLNPSGDNPWTEIGKLGDLTVYDRSDKEQLIPRVADADIILANKVPLTDRVLSELPKLRFVSVLATGYNVVDISAARQLGIDVSNVPVYGTDSVAQFVFALLLEHCHNVALHNDLVHRGQWCKSEDFCFWKTPLTELADKTMGIVGFGRIGRKVGQIACALGMNIIACDDNHSPAPEYQPFAWKSLEELFAHADVVSLHCPQTEDNLHMVNSRLLGLMKSSAILINTARGGLVNETDLADALNTGKIAAAAVDVISQEPMQLDNPLLKAKNCIITPHIAWATLEARRRLLETTAKNIAAFIAGQPINVVN